MFKIDWKNVQIDVLATLIWSSTIRNWPQKNYLVQIPICIDLDWLVLFLKMMGHSTNIVQLNNRKSGLLESNSIGDEVLTISNPFK